MSNIFVCFIGLDGSGKSTLTSKIFEKQRSQKIKVKKIYGRYMPILLKPMMKLGKLIFLKNNNMEKDYESYLENKTSLFKKRSFLSKLYYWFIITEYYFEIIIKINLFRKLGYSIISDRYVYDTIINDIAIDFMLTDKEALKLLKKFWKFCPKPDLVFFVKVSEEVSFKRKDDIPSINYLQIRNYFYNKMAESEKFVVLDGTLNIDNIERVVLEKISEIKNE